jgi:uncharacterized protein (TIGR03382 family)
MRSALVLLATLLASQAQASSVAPGLHLFPGKPTVKATRGDVRTGYQQRGVRVGKKILKATGNVAPVTIGSTVTIRGQRFTPISVRQGADVTVTSGGHGLAPLPPPTFPKKLAIVTHSMYRRGLPHLDDFVKAKQARGWDVVVVTETDWNPTNLVGQAAADALRGWLKANYLTQGIGYVLLIGSPDPNVGLVPMKLVWPLKYLCDGGVDPTYCEMQSVPTDYYFSDLSGNWDLDGNGFAGEYPGDMGEGGVDFGPEVIVGRIPVSASPSLADYALQRAMAYEAAPDHKGRNRVLLASALLGIRGMEGATADDDGALSMSAIGSRLAAADPDLVFTKMFEEEGLAKSRFPSDYALSQDHLQQAFKYGHGLAIWYAHGYPTTAHRMVWAADKNKNGKCDDDEYEDHRLMDSFQMDGLSGTKTPAFLWEISCLNGLPELEYNLASMMLLYSTISSIAATRSAFGEDNSGDVWEPSPATPGAETFAATWADQMAAHMTVGEALAYTKYALPSDGWDDLYPPRFYGTSLTGMGLHGKFIFNLYGDPTLTWDREAGPHDPNWPPQEVVAPDAGVAGFDAATPGPDATAAGLDAATPGPDASAPGADAGALVCPAQPAPSKSGCSTTGGGTVGMGALALVVLALRRRR